MREPKRLTLNDLSIGQEVRLYDTNTDEYYQARILATDIKHDNPIVLASFDPKGKCEDIETADIYGYVNGHTYIVESPEYFECWINVYRTDNNGFATVTHMTEASCISSVLHQDPKFIKTIHVKEEI